MKTSFKSEGALRASHHRVRSWGVHLTAKSPTPKAEKLPVEEKRIFRVSWSYNTGKGRQTEGYLLRV